MPPTLKPIMFNIPVLLLTDEKNKCFGSGPDGSRFFRRSGLKNWIRIRPVFALTN